MTKFKKGKSGNPSGRPAGARHRVTIAVEALLEGEAEGLTRKAIELALEGDVTALRLCLERIAPARKDAPVTFEMPEMKTAADAAGAVGAILENVAAGHLSPDEARSIAPLIETYRKTLETEDLERRITALEAKKMNQLDKRVTGLERTGMVGSNAPTLLKVSFMAPGHEGPVRTAIGVLGERGDGRLLFSSNFATEDEFTTAVNDWHIRVHGTPIKNLTEVKA